MGPALNPAFIESVVFLRTFGERANVREVGFVMAEYPKKPSHFAHKITRLLFKSCAAQSIGHHSVLLVIHIAHTEDAVRYQYPPRFWNSQLNEVLGFKSPKQLNDARQSAVNAGWLFYDRKHDRADGEKIWWIRCGWVQVSYSRWR